MATHPLPGKPAPRDMLIDPATLEKAYYDGKPDPADPRQAVSFGTSGHRGTPLDGTFTEAHILAITQAICEWRHQKGIDGPMCLGMDTHAVSARAQQTALEVLAANGVTTLVAKAGGATPTPVISWSILTHNKGRKDKLADGIVITPSHNPPEDGGIKYNPTNGGPADTDVTGWMQQRANELLAANNKDVKRVSLSRRQAKAHIEEHDYITPFITDLKTVIDMEAISRAKVKIGVDPLGGASAAYWDPIAAMYQLDLTVVNRTIDPTFSFMPVDHDGKIRMDCSSPFAMANLVRLANQYQVAFGNDPDADRHGIVTPAGLMNPNHYLAVAISYLLTHRPKWPATSAIGKTVVSSGIIDRVVAHLGRRLSEVPVGFKWFSPGLFDGSYCFGGEESAGASFLRTDGTVWTTDKDGLILGLLAAEITATTGSDPGVHYQKITRQFGTPYYTRVDAPATPRQKSALKGLSPSNVTATELAGEPIVARLTNAPGNNAGIGGLKVATENGWFAARPSGTENIYKIYAESFKDQQHLDTIVEQARELVNRTIGE